MNEIPPDKEVIAYLAAGGITAGLLADALNIPFAMAAIGGLTVLSGLVVAAFMYETLPTRRKPQPDRPAAIPESRDLKTESPTIRKTG